VAIPYSFDSKLFAIIEEVGPELKNKTYGKYNNSEGKHDKEIADEMSDSENHGAGDQPENNDF